MVEHSARPGRNQWPLTNAGSAIETSAQADMRVSAVRGEGIQDGDEAVTSVVSSAVRIGLDDIERRLQEAPKTSQWPIPR